MIFMKYLIYLLLLFVSILFSCQSEPPLVEETNIATTIDEDSLKSAMIAQTSLEIPVDSSMEEETNEPATKKAVSEKIVAEAEQNAQEKIDTLKQRVDKSVFRSLECCPTLFTTTDASEQECCCKNVAERFKQLEDVVQRVDIKKTDVYFGRCDQTFRWFEDAIIPGED
jgi:hypothetical protein